MRDAAVTERFTRSLTVTVDLEDPRMRPEQPKTYDRTVRELLRLLAELEVRASFFVVGELAAADPGLVREIAAQGHEVGLHGWQHRPLTELTATAFHADSRRGKETLEEITGTPVTGFRAPIFSLTARTPWADRILAEIGYRYSSSLLPARHPFHSYPGMPCGIFRWPSGLLEFPAPVAGVGPLRVPYLGGFYLRYLPASFIHRSLRRSDGGDLLWCYCHPHDFDDGEPFRRIRNTPLWMSWLLWFNRRRTWGRLRALLTHESVECTPPFGFQVGEGRFDGIPRLRPESLDGEYARGG